MRSRWILLGWATAVIALIFGSIVRLYGLESNPPGLWQDEASTGLDAYLLWTTGRDRAGDFLPIIARSFGDYPLALYRYLDAPIVGLLGLTIGHERLVSALAGSLMIAATAWAVRPVLGNKAALGAVLSGALAPTWVHFSRYGSEAILLPFTLILGVALIENARAKERWLGLWLGAVSIAASAYTYHAVKIFLPLWLAAFLWYQAPLIRSLWHRRRRHVIGPAIVFSLLVLPSVIAALTPEGMARGRTVAAWTHYSGIEMMRLVLNNYLAYFDPGLLFVRGGPAVAQSIPGLGLWSLIDLPLIAAGILVMLRGGPGLRFHRFVALWFLLGPLPGGITYETHNIGRVIGWLPAPQIMSAIGFASLCGWIASRWRSDAARPRLKAGLLALGSFTAFVLTAAALFHLTLVRYPQVTERDWQFEISRALLCAKEKRGLRQIVVAPQFQAAEVFAKFHLIELPPLSPERPAWVFGNRTIVAPGEIYVAPASERRPPGEVLCDIRLRTGGDTKAYVVSGPDAVIGAEPIAPPAIGPRPKPALQNIKLKTRTATIGRSW